MVVLAVMVVGTLVIRVDGSDHNAIWLKTGDCHKTWQKRVARKDY
jgi:hypothetical protein